MSSHAISHRPTVMTNAALARTLGPASLLVVRGPLRRTAAIASDVLALAGVVFCIPFVILGIGIPIALFVRLLLWIGRLL